MIIVDDDHPVPSSNPNPKKTTISQQSQTLAQLLHHPTLIAASTRLKQTPLTNLTNHSPQIKHVYVFQREFATVNPALVQMVGTDEATTCVGVVIRNRRNGMISVAHFDFVGVVDGGLGQMVASVGDGEEEEDYVLDVHLIGSFEDAANDEEVGENSETESEEDQGGYSLPLCEKIIEALERRQETFHLQTLCVLGHNTQQDSYGNPCPIVSGFVVYTSSGSVIPASFSTPSRCPDEIVRRIRVTVSSDDPNLKGRLLETYDTCHDRFQITPFSWSSRWEKIAFSLHQLSNSEILFRCSTSPFAEAPDFVETQRRIWSYLIKYPDWRRTFPGRKPHIFERTTEGGWLRLWG